MSKTIWKFQLEPVISMPKGAEILTVQTQAGTPFVWALVNPEAENEYRYFDIFGTGHNVPVGTEVMKYVATYQLHGGNLVFHVFEKDTSKWKREKR